MVVQYVVVVASGLSHRRNHSLRQFTNFCSCIVLIIYEYLVTLDAEVRFFWRKEVNSASILFFLNRYLNLFYRLFIAGLIFPIPDYQVRTSAPSSLLPNSLRLQGYVSGVGWCWYATNLP